MAERSSAGSSSPEREIIADQDADRPRWAPDGKHFAFLLNKRRWLASLDCRFRRRSRNRNGHEQADFNRDRSQRRTMVPRRQEHSFHFRRISRMRWRARSRISVQREKIKRSRAIKSKGADFRSPALSPLECLQRRQAQPPVRDSPPCLRAVGNAGAQPGL